MLKAVAAWCGVVFFFAVAVAGSWAMYDECFGEDYNYKCRTAYMAAREAVRDFILGPRSTDHPASVDTRP